MDPVNQSSTKIKSKKKNKIRKRVKQYSFRKTETNLKDRDTYDSYHNHPKSMILFYI